MTTPASSELELRPDEGWDAEIRRRCDAIDRGEMKLISQEEWDAAEDELRQELGLGE